MPKGAVAAMSINATVAMRPDAAPAVARIANAAATPRQTVRNAKPG